METSMQIWREEIFGPVLCVKTFRTEEEAIELANDTQWVAYPCYWSNIWDSAHKIVVMPADITCFFSSYGLAGAVISKDTERCQRISEVEPGILFPTVIDFKTVYHASCWWHQIWLVCNQIYHFFQLSSSLLYSNHV